MRTLHLLRSPPPEPVIQLIEDIGGDTLPLDEDYDALLAAILAHERVVCWW